MYGRNYNFAWMLLWLAVVVFMLVREFVLPARMRDQIGGPNGGPNGGLAVVVALALALYNFTRWWAMRAAYDPTRGVRVNPLAEARYDPDNPPLPVVPNPELDFTKPNPDKPAE